MWKQEITNPWNRSSESGNQTNFSVTTIPLKSTCISPTFKNDKLHSISILYLFQRMIYNLAIYKIFSHFYEQYSLIFTFFIDKWPLLTCKGASRGSSLGQLEDLDWFTNRSKYDCWFSLRNPYAILKWTSWEPLFSDVKFVLRFSGFWHLTQELFTEHRYIVSISNTGVII